MKTHTRILLATVAAAFIAVGCATTKSPTWEYKTRTSTNRITMSMLGNYGKSGWELVTVDHIPVVRTDTNSVATTNLMYQYLFKRPKH
jgi:LPS O-antigen subunit length determinant protein (WzzB/FepE family)